MAELRLGPGGARTRAAGVSVIIPAHNAGGTLASTLDSLRQQTHAHWEAIVVDDGSTDGTNALARHYARLDSRIRPRRQKRRGEAAARNHGLDQARNDWVLFLDADDTIAPSHMQQLLDALRTDDSLQAAYCDWVRVAPDGTRGEAEVAPDPAALFAISTHRCPFAIHSCIVRRRLVQEIGAFDTSLGTCPDWDLWQRVARTGARAIHVPEPLALYWMRPASAGGRALQVLNDGWQVIERGHASDARVKRPDSRFASGQNRARMDAAKSDFICWIAGLLIGNGSRAEFLVHRLHNLDAPRVDPCTAAFALLQATLLPTCRTAQDWPSCWPAVSPRIRDFLAALETATATPGLANDVEQQMLSRIPVTPVAGTSPRPQNTTTVAGRGRSRGHESVILLYHRITTGGANPWQLAVSPANFEQQLEVLGSWAHFASLDDVSGASAETRGRRLAAVTFDDGYADNLYEALPVLARKGVPATVFTVASRDPRPTHFWWDRLAYLMLDCALPADLEIRFDGGPVQWERERSRSGVRRPEDSGGGAQDVFMKVWSRLRQVEPARRDEWIDGLYERCEQAPMPPDRHRRLAHAELARLAGAGIEIGAHTMSHPALALLPAADQDVEIRASRRTLEDVTGRQITSFSYPFGSAADYTAETKSIVRAAGFRLACSGTDGRVTHSTDRFELPRLQVPDLDGASFETWLLRKLARVAAA